MGGRNDGAGKHLCQEDTWKGKAVLEGIHGKEKDRCSFCLGISACRSVGRLSPVGKWSGRLPLMAGSMEEAFDELEEFHLRD